MKSINQSYIYSNILVVDETFKEKINKLDDSFLVSHDILDYHITILGKKYRRFPLTHKILKYYDEKKIRPVMSPKMLLFDFLPIIGKVTSEGEPVIYIDLFSYAVIKKNELIIDLQTLYSLLEYSVFLYDYNVLKEYKKIENNITIIKQTPKAYSKMVFKIFDKLYGFSIDEIKSDILRYIYAKFCLINIFGKPADETTNEIAYSCIFNNTTKKTILSVDNFFDDQAYENIINVTKNVKKLKGFENILAMTFVREFTRFYGEASILSLEFFPGIIFVIMNSLGLSDIVQQIKFNNLIQDEMNLIYTEIVRIIK